MTMLSTRYVPGVGPSNPKILFVGEAPGEQEEFQGKPFVGPSGTLLNSMLASVGIDRHSCYLTNVCKVRPPNNDFGAFYADTKRREPTPFLSVSIADLRREIQEHRPNVIVPLGAEPLRAICGKSPISAWRGSIIQTDLGKVIPTYHPSYILRQWIDRVTAERDLRRVIAESSSPSCDLPRHEFEISPTFDRVVQYLTQVKKEKKRVSFDIETSGPFVRCLGLSTDIHHAFCIPFMANISDAPSQMGTTVQLIAPPPTRNSYWTPHQEHAILTLLNDMFLDPTIPKVAQNFPFDALVLARDFGFDCSPGLHMDTMVAHHACYSELPKGLDYLCSVYTRVPYYSDFDSGVDRETWQYNCYDAAVTLEISYVLDREMEELGILEYYKNLLHPALLAYTRAETRGVLVDLPLREQVKTRTITDLATLTERLQRTSNNEIKNPDSDSQVKKYLYTTLKLPIVLHHKTKNPTTDKNARLTLSRKHPQHQQLFDDLEEHSTKSTLLSSFLNAELGSDGRIRTHYNLAGTVTGRLASSVPLFDPGTNLQNIPRGDFRRLFIADPGWSLLKADLSQAEFRIVVWKAAIRRIIDKYLCDPNYDIHTFMAGQIFSKAEDKVLKSERTTAKNGVYGGQYGMYYTTAARTYKLDLQMAKFVLDRFRQLFPEIEHVFWASIKNELASSGRKITGPLGRRRFFFDRLDDDLYRSAYSHFAQHLVGDLISRAFAILDRACDPGECFPLLQVHDEIVSLVRNDRIEQYAGIVKRVMEYPVFFPGVPEPLIIPAEVSVGPNWFDQKKVI